MLVGYLGSVHDLSALKNSQVLLGDSGSPASSVTVITPYRSQTGIQQRLVLISVICEGLIYRLKNIWDKTNEAAAHFFKVL